WKQVRSNLFQRGALLFVRFLVDVDIVKIPIPERFKHALALWTLNILSQRQPIERRFAIFTRLDENCLHPVACHARGKRFEPTWTSRSAGAGLLEISRDFPGSFGFGWVGGNSRHGGHANQQTTQDRRAK